MTTISNLKPLRDSVFVEDLDHGAHLSKHGIILLDDNMSERGIHARWGKVYAVGPDVNDLKVGHWVLVEHGRWTNAMTIVDQHGERKIWRIEYPKAALMSADEDPRDAIQSHAHGLRTGHHMHKHF